MRHPGGPGMLKNILYFLNKDLNMIRVRPDPINFRGVFMKRLSRTIILLSLLIISFPQALLAEETAPVDLTILHVNDTHGRILPYIEATSGEQQMVGGAAYLARMIQEERSKNPDGTLLLSAGDMFQGTPVSNLFKGQIRDRCDELSEVRCDGHRESRIRLGNGCSPASCRFFQISLSLRKYKG